MDASVPVRVRPHVAKAVANARYVLLDFDDVCFSLPEKTCGPWQFAAALATSPGDWAGTSISGVAYMLAHLAEHEPELAAVAEPIASRLEHDAAVAGRVRKGLPELLDVCAKTSRPVWVLGEIDEDAMRAGLRAHGLDERVAMIAGRNGLDRETIGVLGLTWRATRQQGVDPAHCLLVSGRWGVLYSGRDSGIPVLGVPGRHDERRWLSQCAPVVSNLDRLGHALSGAGERG